MAWLKNRGVIGLAGIDTRALTARIREQGMPNAVIAHEPSGNFDLDALKRQAREWPGMIGLDLVPMVTTAQRFTWDETPWRWGEGYGRADSAAFQVVAVDYGIKRNILRQLAGHACKVTVVPAQTAAEDILALKPDGVFLSNGPGDPAATGEYAVPVIRSLIEKVPTFGIRLGHQMLALAIGAKTVKMHQGHHGANHPVKDLQTGKVEITSMNHGFAVDRATLPAHAVETHVSLFDGSNCGLRAQGPAGIFGAVSPGGVARPARQPLSFRPFRPADGRIPDQVVVQVIFQVIIRAIVREALLSKRLKSAICCVRRYKISTDVGVEGAARSGANARHAYCQETFSSRDLSFRRRRVDPQQRRAAARGVSRRHRSVRFARPRTVD